MAVTSEQVNCRECDLGGRKRWVLDWKWCDGVDDFFGARWGVRRGYGWVSVPGRRENQMCDGPLGITGWGWATVVPGSMRFGSRKDLLDA